jgi:LAGLIDADG endonuclease
VVDSAFGHWLAGLADGEGCFIVYPVNGAQYATRFTIRLRVDDWPMLEEIHRRTAIGTLNRESRPRGTAWGDLARWTVETKAACVALVELFDTYPLRSKKARDYALWREAVLLRATRSRGDGWERMAAISDELTAVRRLVA